jgi:hypothetical protein
VTVLNQARKVKKGHVQEGRKIQTNFAIQARAKIDQNVLMLANVLKNLQGQVSSQFGVVAGLANRLGVKAKASPNMVEGPEALEAAESTQGRPPSGPGPYKSPGDMAKVLSGKMMPGGMINFSDDGMGDVVADAMDKIKEKKDKLKEELDKFKDNSKEIQELATSCIGANSSDNVGNGACGQECSSALKEGSCNTNVSDIVAACRAAFPDSSVEDTFKKGFDALDKCGDDTAKAICENCISTKKASYAQDKATAEGAAKSAGEEK